MRKFFFKIAIIFGAFLIPLQASLAQDVDVNYGMTNWEEYGFQTIPKGIIELLEAENYRRAIFKLRKHMNDDNGRVNPEAWLLNARALLNEQKYKVAQRTAQRVLNHFPDHPEMLAVISLSYLYGRNDFEYATDFAERTAKSCGDCRLSKHLMRLIAKRQGMKDLL